MALVKMKPTSPGRRGMVKVVTEGLYKGRPFGGGHKQHYRLVDFKRQKDGIPAKVERIEYDPNRTAHIALLKYADEAMYKAKRGAR